MAACSSLAQAGFPPEISPLVWLLSKCEGDIFDDIPYLIRLNACSCGAGTIALGIGPDGEHVRASGWGPAFLDGGSGYDIGEPGFNTQCLAMLH